MQGPARAQCALTCVLRPHLKPGEGAAHVGACCRSVVGGGWPSWLVCWVGAGCAGYAVHVCVGGRRRSWARVSQALNSCGTAKSVPGTLHCPEVRLHTTVHVICNPAVAHGPPRRHPNFSTFPLTDTPVGPPATAAPTQPPAQPPTATGVAATGSARLPSSLGPPTAPRNTSQIARAGSPIVGTASTTSFLYTPFRSNEDITSQGGASMVPSGPSAVPPMNDSTAVAVNDPEDAAAQAAAPGTLPYQPYGTPAGPCSRMTYMSAFAAPPASVRWPSMAAIQLSQPPSHGTAGLSGQHPLQTLHEHDSTYSALQGQLSQPRPGSLLQTSSTPLVMRRSVPATAVAAAEPRDPGLPPLAAERTSSGRRSEDHVGRFTRPSRTLPPLPFLPRRASAGGGGGGGGGISLPTPSVHAWDPAADDPAARMLPSRQAGPCAEGTEGPAGADGQTVDASLLGGANGNGSVGIRRVSDGTGRPLASASVSRRTTVNEGQQDQAAPGGVSAPASAGGAAPGVGVIVGIIGRATLLKLLEVRRDIGNMAAAAAAVAAPGGGTGGSVGGASATAAAPWSQQQQQADRDGGACTATGVQTGPWWNPLAQLRSRGRHSGGGASTTAAAVNGTHPTSAGGSGPTASRTRTRSGIPSFTFSFSFSLWSKDHASRKPAAAAATPAGPAATAAGPAAKRDGGGTAAAAAAAALSRASSGGSEPTTWLRSRQPPMSRGSAIKLLDAVDPYPAKAPADRPGEEALFASLEGGPGGHMDALLDLRHYMQVRWALRCSRG